MKSEVSAKTSKSEPDKIEPDQKPKKIRRYCSKNRRY